MSGSDYVNANIAEWEGPQMLRHRFVPSANAAKQFRVKLTHTGKEPVQLYGLVIMERERRLRS